MLQKCCKNVAKMLQNVTKIVMFCQKLASIDLVVSLRGLNPTILFNSAYQNTLEY